MLYAKLIWRNLKRSTKEYAIYMMTLVIAIMLMYAFNGVALSAQIQALSMQMEQMMTGIIVASILIVFVLGWLIYYISNFILQKRSKEFGMYILMGMSRREVSRMFLMEQACMGLLAFLIGCILGVFAYQIIQAIIMNTFSQEYQFSIQFSTRGAGLTLLYFIGLYLMEMLRELHYIKKQSIYELLYRNRKHQAVKQHKKLSIGMFFFGILTFFMGLKALDISMGKNVAGSTFLFSIVLLVLSIFLLFFGLSYRIRSVVERHKKLKYKGNSLYLTSQLCTRLQSNRMVLSLLSILTLTTLLLVCVGMKFKESQSVSERLMPYDVIAATYTEEPLNVRSITDYMAKHHIKYQDHMYSTYQLPYQAQALLRGTSQEALIDRVEDFTYLKYSDYKRLSEVMGEEAHTLKDDEYLVLSDAFLKDSIQENAKEYQFAGLHNTMVDDLELGQSRYEVIWIVVPDKALQDAKVKSTATYVVKSDTPSTQDWNEEIEPVFKKDNDIKVTSFTTKHEWTSRNLTSVVVIVFALIYIAMILACVNATVLAIHQMSDVWKQKENYHMLHHMGVSRKAIHHLLARQIGIYFFVPFVIPVLYVVPIILILDKMFMRSYARSSMLPYVGVAVLFYLVIYLGYYVLAYFNSKQSIQIE